MQCITINVFGSVQLVNANSDGTCPTNAYILLNNADYAMMVQAYEITPEQVFQVFSWGFGVVLLFWFFGYGIGVAKKVISKI
jgi:hypothetical protein